MSYLVISPLSQLHKVAKQHQPREMITLLKAGTAVECPIMVNPEKHYFLSLNDITYQQDNLIMPNAAHIDDIVTIAYNWDRAHPLLIHCLMGISRSTACAFIIACTLNPQISEHEIAAILRKNAPFATPNHLMIDLADQKLGRSGCMRVAINKIGRGAEASEGIPFIMPVNF
ncbi:tyrosine phosphatase family protein [Bartonella tamiae]|uniref:Tyrosine specific protein phosphatases domain-containing protein n=1 Tax=Bartonella tamiae Th239 TaxID=1094558 RepID=J0QX65_9HYPH|nr:hypothetical protein [Bartonella tamiae]EJF90636.1 hypothetical protein ME5_01037 [Bartonella tamiae Th239]EJF93987.1 hypothetical protein MEG_00845 [Bartonella tamiae Th307]